MITRGILYVGDLSSERSWEEKILKLKRYHRTTDRLQLYKSPRGPIKTRTNLSF
jgi:hypothetical protein